MNEAKLNGSMSLYRTTTCQMPFRRIYFLIYRLISFKSGHQKISFKGHLHKTAKIGPIFAVRLILPGCLSDFCMHLTDRHHIAQNLTER
jgi:hypothetical protein